MWHNSKTPIVTKPNCEKTQQIRFYKDQKTQMWQQPKTQIATKLKNINGKITKKN